jgi:hypothetical protein
MDETFSSFIRSLTTFILLLVTTFQSSKNTL